MRWILLVALAAGCGGSGAPVPMPMPDLASAPAAFSWSNGGQAFFQRYCVSCHSPSGMASQQDFGQYAVVMANASVIRCGVAPSSQPASGCQSAPVSAGQFPIGGGPKPSDAERLAVVAWIDAGLPQ